MDSGERLTINISDSPTPKLNLSGDNKNDIQIKDLSSPSKLKSVNFGPGADLLMNHNQNRSSTPKSNIDISDLKELNSVDLNEKSNKKSRNSLLSSIGITGDLNNSKTNTSLYRSIIN